MRRFVQIGSALAAAVVTLAACGGVTVGPGTPPSADVTVVSSTNPDAPVRNITIGANESVFVRIDVPSNQRGVGRRLVVEADDDGGATALDLVLYAANGVSPIASTSGTAYFRPGLQGLDGGFIGTSLATRTGRTEPGAERSVSVVGQCFGPCISRRADVSVAYVEIRNRSPFTDLVPFYAYTEAWIDETEPANDVRFGAPDLSPADAFYRGAIERLGDVDFVRFAADGSVTFDGRAGYDLDAVLQIVTSGGQPIQGERYRVGDGPFDVFAGEYARIESEAPRASVYGYYTLAYE